MSIDLHSSKPCFSVEFVDRYFRKLGVEELRVEERDEVESGGVGSRGVGSGEVSGSGRFSGCFAVDSAVHKSLLTTPLSFHYWTLRELRWRWKVEVEREGGGSRWRGTTIYSIFYLWHISSL